MIRARFGVTIAVTTLLLVQSLLLPGALAVQEPITETLLQQPSGAPTAGRLWPGFAAGQGLDTGAQADPSGPKPEQVDTGATADPAGSAPAPITTSLTAPGLGAGSGGDLSAPTAPWMGSGAAAATGASTSPLAGGIPTYGGTSLGGGSPLAGGTSLAGFGNMAAGMLGQGIPGMGGLGGLAGLGMLGQGMGLQGLGNVMGLVGMVSVLNSLPQMIGQLPQLVQSIGPMLLTLFQSPDMFFQALSGTGQGLMGMGGQLGQIGQLGQVAQVAGALPGAVQGAVQGAAGGVAGSAPFQPQSVTPQTPSGPGNTSRVGGFDTGKAWQKWQTDNAGSTYCGRGVYNILSEQGYNVIPGNGEDWNENLASLGWEKVKISSPSQAPIGSVLVYEDSNGTNGGGAQWGHVEVVSEDPNGNRVYLAGTRSYNPGGTVPQNWDGYAWLPPGS